MNSPQIKLRHFFPITLMASCPTHVWTFFILPRKQKYAKHNSTLVLFTFLTTALFVTFSGSSSLVSLWLSIHTYTKFFASRFLNFFKHLFNHDFHSLGLSRDLTRDENVIRFTGNFVIVSYLDLVVGIFEHEKKITVILGH